MALDWLRNRVSEASSAVNRYYQQYANADYADASIAVALLISYADGNVSPEEKQKLNQFFLTSDALKNMNAEDLQKKIGDLDFKFNTDLNIGKIEALKKISRFRGKSGEARSLVNLGILIAKSDGEFHDTEKALIKEICLELDLPLEDFF